MKYLIAFLSLFSLAFASEDSKIIVFKKDDNLFLKFKILELEKTFNHLVWLISSCKNEPADKIFDVLSEIQGDLSCISFEIEGCKYLIGELGYRIQD